ncbi:MAG: hypothetical protein A2W33_03105 [Chloroflexi bacterium RBG_16_52_11]|nr:MAG: hypothetical protein A2W33_03105 [Chloroflexi bacterium RBG_16_52_11]
MNKERSVRFLFHLGMVWVLVFVAAMPLVTALAASAQVRLTIDNRSPKPLQLSLSGPAIYNFKVEGNDKEVFAVNRGVYDYTMSGCGRTANGTLDLSVNKTLIMPVCGASAANLVREPNMVDLGQVLKVVKIKVENLATGDSLVILTGPSTYVFSVKEDAKVSYTVAKGQYKVQIYACGDYGTSTFEAYKDASLKVRCP